MTDEIDKDSKVLFVFDNLYTMYKNNTIKQFEDLNLITFNLTFKDLEEFRQRRTNGQETE